MFCTGRVVVSKTKVYSFKVYSFLFYLMLTRAHECQLRRVCCVTLLTDSDLQVLQRRHTRGRRQHRLLAQNRTVTRNVPAGVHELHLQHKTHQYHGAALLIGCLLWWPRESNELQMKKHILIDLTTHMLKILTTQQNTETRC